MRSARSADIPVRSNELRKTRPGIAACRHSEVAADKNVCAPPSRYIRAGPFLLVPLRLRGNCLFARLREFVNLPIEDQKVKLPLAVLGETGDGMQRIGLDQFAVGGHLSVLVTQTPDGAHPEVGIHINATQGWQLFTSINVAARNADARAVVGEPAIAG